MNSTDLWRVMITRKQSVSTAKIVTQVRKSVAHLSQKEKIYAVFFREFRFNFLLTVVQLGVKE